MAHGWRNQLPISDPYSVTCAPISVASMLEDSGCAGRGGSGSCATAATRVAPILAETPDPPAGAEGADCFVRAAADTSMDMARVCDEVPMLGDICDLFAER